MAPKSAGGGSSSAYTATDRRVKVGKATRVVYVRRGKAYVKRSGAFVPFAA
jgi:hypothetical protein